MQKTLKRLNAAVLELPTNAYMMWIEGHTDDVPINTAKFRSNWELASARAVNVLYVFENNGFPREKLAALAFADTQPKVPNRDAAGTPLRDNQATNRRVLVYIKPAKS